MSEEVTDIIGLADNILAGYEDDREVPKEILEELMYLCSVELRERDEEGL